MSDPQIEAMQEWATANAVEGLPDTPAEWFAAKFPGLEERQGKAVEEALPRGKEGGRPYVRDLSEDFLAATLGEDGTPEAPVVYVPVEDRFYRYSQQAGIYVEEREPVLATELSALLLACARACADKVDTKNLEFKFRDSAALKGVLTRARGMLGVAHDFFETDLMEFVPCANGMLRRSDRRLLPFGPGYRRRNKLAVPYLAGASCPLFLNTLLEPALEPDDIDLLQVWCGLALIGVNLAQRLLLLTGTAGGGKGTLIRVLTGIIGAGNVGSLRPHQLTERFELGRLLGKTVLYGADVPENFLNCRGASVIKALTGGDPMTLEFKGSNERPEITCRFNAVVTCNSRLTVHLEGDTEAWRRRLVVIEYKRAKPKAVIADLSERILKEEGPGVLNWMLDGLDRLKAGGWQLVLNDRQQEVVDDLLLESEADAVFARECLSEYPDAHLTVARCHERFVEYCNERGWMPMPKKRFATAIADTVVREFGLTVRNDIPDERGKSQRGWKGLACK